MAKEVAKENDAKLHPVAAFITNSINVVMTGKGGVGKSYVAQTLSQYFLHYKRIATSTSDSDPVNASTFRIKALILSSSKSWKIILFSNLILTR